MILMVDLFAVSALSSLSNDDQITAMEPAPTDLPETTRETKEETKFILDLLDKVVHESNCSYSICIKSFLKIDEIGSLK